MRASVGVYFYNAPISSHPGRVTLGTYASKPRDLVSFQGQIQDFFRKGCTRLLLYFNTNKPDSFVFFLQNTSGIWKPQVILGGVRTPCTLPLDLSLVLLAIFSPGCWLHYLKGSLGKDPRDFYHWLNRQQFEIELVLLCKDQEPPLPALPTYGGVLISA